MGVKFQKGKHQKHQISSFIRFVSPFPEIRFEILPRQKPRLDPRTGKELWSSSSGLERQNQRLGIGPLLVWRCLEVFLKKSMFWKLKFFFLNDTWQYDSSFLVFLERFWETKTVSQLDRDDSTLYGRQSHKKSIFWTSQKKMLMLKMLMSILLPFFELPKKTCYSMFLCYRSSCSPWNSVRVHLHLRSPSQMSPDPDPPCSAPGLGRATWPGVVTGSLPVTFNGSMPKSRAKKMGWSWILSIGSELWKSFFGLVFTKPTNSWHAKIT